MKDPDHLASPPPYPASSSQMTRREFFKRMGLLGGGIVVYRCGRSNRLLYRQD